MDGKVAAHYAYVGDKVTDVQKVEEIAHEQVHVRDRALVGHQDPKKYVAEAVVVVEGHANHQVHVHLRVGAVGLVRACVVDPAAAVSPIH